ncbi:MAG: penicillin-binding protein activator [Robiginitomaculum sp.]|nr:MAG: penicillin-binding protein activator [Robiginitomaculum sp.]
MTLYPVSGAKASLFKSTGVKVLRACLMVLGGVVLLNACATTPQPGPYRPGPATQGPTPVTPQTPRPDITEPDTPTPTKGDKIVGLTPPFMNTDNIRRVAILLPFSAQSPRLREEAASMLQAAELALFARDDDSVLLMALDSAGTPAGASIAARKAIAQGADIILGPILAGSVRASGEIARAADVPMIAFSTDTTVAGDGVYLLSFPPEAEVKRVTEFVAESGATKFAFLGPDSNYGRRVLSAYRESVADLDGVMNGIETYTGKDITVMQDPARKLAQLYTQTLAQNEAEGRPRSEVAFHVVLLPEGGTALRSLAPLLPFFEENINPGNVQFMGTGLWNREDVAREPAIRNGIFAGPDLEAKQMFNDRFDAIYGEEPSRLASLAYDALNIAAFVAEGDRDTRAERLTDEAGFFGVDGLVRFDASGTPERGLAIYQVRGGRFVIIDPAPKSSDGAF